MEPSKAFAHQYTVKKRPDTLKIELQEDSCNDGGGREGGRVACPMERHSTVAFRSLSQHTREGIFSYYKKPKQILHQINGDFQCGDLSAIMGPSGSGKTTLMNILAGYTTSGITGRLLTDGHPRCEPEFRSYSCYIMQNDILQDLLTVSESMVIAASLKLPITFPHKRQKVRDILESMSLWECRKVRVCSLSGGQKKRLSIAMELLTNPPVLFLDEPTTGLDCLTSKQCIALLKQIASSGRTVICTVHQPSAMIFELFDRVYALANGHCIYQGSVKGLIPYLADLNLYCPTYHNPADFLLEIASGDFGDLINVMADKCENGLSTDWIGQRFDSLHLSSLDHINRLMKSGQMTPIGVAPILQNFSRNQLKTTSFYATSFLHQLNVMIRRTMLLVSRDRTLTYSRMITHLAIALFIGILYRGIGRDASNMLNNFNYMFFSLMFLMFTAFSCITTTFPAELPIITREYFNKWYSLVSYYLAVTLVDIPIQLAATLIYVLVTYFLTMQPVEPFRLFSFLFMCILVSLVAQSFGLLIGATMDVKHGVIFGPILLAPFTIFSGFFVQQKYTHPYMRWLFHISFLKHGLDGLVLSILGYDRGKMPCNAEYCHFVYPEKFLDEMDLVDYEGYSRAALFLTVLTIAIRIVTYFGLQFHVTRSRSN